MINRDEYSNLIGRYITDAADKQAFMEAIEIKEDGVNDKTDDKIRSATDNIAGLYRRITSQAVGPLAGVLPRRATESKPSHEQYLKISVVVNEALAKLYEKDPAKARAAQQHRAFSESITNYLRGG
jgi:hypothetical protein